MNPKARRILGAALLFSGAALVAHILSGVSLRLSLLFTTALLITAVALVIRRSRPADRAKILRIAGAGAIAGITATATYDATKYFLSRGMTGVYNPFEALRAFGLLLAGPSASPTATLLSGIAFHALNGVSFGVAYCFLFRRWGLWSGIAWGLFLELFQLTLFPGWLDIRSYREFVQVSAASHLVYGATLSIVSKAILRENGAQPGSTKVTT